MGHSLQHWLSDGVSPEEKRRVEEIGLITALKKYETNYFATNLERGLLLRRLIVQRKPRRILEIGTGRGFGTICMADCAEDKNLSCEITTIDVIDKSTPQTWPRKEGGIMHDNSASLQSVWDHNFPGLSTRISFLTGESSALLEQLSREGKRFDLVFIDAGHDVLSVFGDLAASSNILEATGCILMDDFAPLESFGLATCIATHHATRFFRHVEIVRSEGVCFPSHLPAIRQRSMVFLDEREENSACALPSAAMRLKLRVAGRFLDWLYSDSAFQGKCCRY